MQLLIRSNVLRSARAVYAKAARLEHPRHGIDIEDCLYRTQLIDDVLREMKTVGRKGWLVNDTVKGAVENANLYLFVEEARQASGVEPHAYLSRLRDEALSCVPAQHDRWRRAAARR